MPPGGQHASVLNLAQTGWCWCASQRIAYLDRTGRTGRSIGLAWISIWLARYEAAFAADRALLRQISYADVG